MCHRDIETNFKKTFWNIISQSCIFKYCTDKLYKIIFSTKSNVFFICLIMVNYNIKCSLLSLYCSLLFKKKWIVNNECSPSYCLKVSPYIARRLISLLFPQKVPFYIVSSLLHFLFTIDSRWFPLTLPVEFHLTLRVGCSPLNLAVDGSL